MCSICSLDPHKEIDNDVYLKIIKIFIFFQDRDWAFCYSYSSLK